MLPCLIIFPPLLFSPLLAGGIYLGTFNETWQCEDACMLSTKECFSFTFLTHGPQKDPLNGQCYGGLRPEWHPEPMARKTGTSISGLR